MDNIKLNKINFFNIFLLIFIVGFLFLPKNSFSKIDLGNLLNDDNQAELKEKEAKKILSSLVQDISNKWMDLTVSDDFNLEEQAVLVILKQTITTDASNYFLKESGKTILKNSIKIGSLLVGQDPVEVLKEIDKRILNEAKEYLENWLLQNKIQVNKGNLKISYFDNNKKIYKINFPYIVSYKQGDVAIEIYSPFIIASPLASERYKWEGGIDNISPFIVKVKGKVEKNWSTYKWVGQPDIEVVFDEEVPKIEIEELSFWEKIIANWENVKQFFSDLNPFQAAIGPEVTNLNIFNNNSDFEEIGQTESITEEIIEKQQEIKQIEQIIIPEKQNQENNLNNLQDILDDIAERIDILNQEILKLVGNSKLKDDFVLEEEQDQDELDNQDEQELVDENFGNEQINNPEISFASQSNGNSSIEPNYCEKTIGQEAFRDKVIINEIAWFGTDISSSDEWIELKNISNNEINISGWQILDKTKQIKIVFGNNDIIPAKEFYLLERTDDDSVPNISADNIYKGSLNDTNEALYLFNNNCELEDEVIADSDWLAGDKQEKRTMERNNNDLDWHTYLGNGENGIMGTPKAENSQEPELPIFYPEFSWPMFQQNAQHTGRSNYSVPETIGLKWSYKLVDVETDLGVIISQPIIGKDGIIYLIIGKVGDNSFGKVYALNPDGTEKWIFDLESSSNNLAISKDGETIYAPISNKGVYAINSVDGTEKWIFNAEDLSYVSSITIGQDNNIYFTDNLYLYNIDSDGNLNWRQTGVSRGGSAGNGPAIDSNGIIYVSWPGFQTLTDGKQGALYAYNPENGDIIWNKPLLRGRASSPVVGQDNIIYVTAGTSGYFGTRRQVFAFDSNGDVLWQSGSEYGSVYSPIISSNNKIIVVDKWSERIRDYVWEPMSRIKAFSPTGLVLWELGPNESSSIDTQPILDGNSNIFVGTSVYEEYNRGFRATGQQIQSVDFNGIIRWNVDVNGSILSSFSIGENGNLYVVVSEKVDEDSNQRIIKLYSYNFALPVIKPVFIESELLELEQDFEEKEFPQDFLEENLVEDKEDKEEAGQEQEIDLETEQQQDLLKNEIEKEIEEIKRVEIKEIEQEDIEEIKEIEVSIEGKENKEVEVKEEKQEDQIDVEKIKEIEGVEEENKTEDIIEEVEVEQSEQGDQIDVEKIKEIEKVEKVDEIEIESEFIQTPLIVEVEVSKEIKKEDKECKTEDIIEEVEEIKEEDKEDRMEDIIEIELENNEND
ncbi:MAG: PQQ-binding-like beta-propeller repeat protein [Candidatus Nealsonbacteria bacterium]